MTDKKFLSNTLKDHLIVENERGVFLSNEGWILYLDLKKILLFFKFNLIINQIY